MSEAHEAVPARRPIVLRHAREATLTADDVVFRQSATQLLSCAAFLLAIALVIDRWPRQSAASSNVALVAIAALVMLGLIAVVLAIHAMRASSWQLACDGRRCLIRITSYLVADEETTSPDVLELSLADIRAVREVRVHTAAQLIDSQRTRCFLEIQLDSSIDLSPVIARLRAEFVPRTPGGTDWRDHPVTAPSPHVLWVEWRSESTFVRPGISRALALLGRATHVLSRETRRIYFTRPSSPGERDAAVAGLRALFEQGHPIDAVQIARYACGLDGAAVIALKHACRSGGPFEWPSA